MNSIKPSFVDPEFRPAWFAGGFESVRPSTKPGQGCFDGAGYAGIRASVDQPLAIIEMN